MSDFIRVIVARASSIHERQSPDFVPVDSAHDEKVRDRMALWLHAAAGGDTALFRRHLDWNRTNESCAWRAVASVQLCPGASLPQWALTLQEVLQVAAAVVERERCLDDEKPIAFEELLAPFVTWARRACERQAASAYECFPANVHAILERHLLQSLSGHAARSLWLELSVDVSMAPLDLLAASGSSREVYQAFVGRMLTGGLNDFFLEYSSLARALSSAIELWAEATAEMLRRFKSDAGAIRAMLGINDELEVTCVATSLSDPHNGLRSVSILTFASGDRVVYKPRDLGIDAGWNAFLEWLPAIGSSMSFQTFRVLNYGSHGWSEFVEYASCKDEAEAREYFERAGALLCVVHLLHGTDCHGDNIVAVGPHPVLIDVETMLSPERRSLEIGAEAPRLARKILTGSVLNTYLLPFYAHAVQDGVVFDGSGLGADREQDSATTSEQWAFVNTDRMKLARLPNDRIVSARAAMSDGEPLRVYEYEGELVRGFEAMYRLLMRERRTLLTQGSPFQNLRNVEVRFVHRHTSLYSVVLNALQRPPLCRDGAERSMQIEQLALLSLTNSTLNGHPGWPEVWHAERECMERGDVPQFSVLAGGDTLILSQSRRVPGWFAQSGHARAVERLNKFDEEDLAFQADLIRSSLRSRAPKRDAPAPDRSFPPMPVTEEPWLKEALTIAEWIARDAIRASDGSASWLQPAWSRELMVASARRELDVVGHDLYDGAVGIGLFLAAAERLTQAGFASLAVGAVRPILIELEERGEETAGDIGIGGLSGTGSIVYGLVQMSKLLGDSQLLAGAERAAELITVERIDADLALDVTAGSAGAMLGLLCLYEVTGSESVLARATHCGQRLLDRFEPVGSGIRAIRTLQGRFLNGFSHGAAGIAYALCRLYRLTRDPRLLEGSHQLIEFERESFSKQHGDWPDLRHSDSPRFMAAWCHGAPGIALGRLASLDIIDDEQTRREVDIALEITQQRKVDSADYLCCGAAGRVNILLTAGKLLDRPEISSTARQLAWQAVSRFRETGEYKLGLPSAGRLRSPGLFQGLSGIGYTLLRLARPEILPELLLLC